MSKVRPRKTPEGIDWLAFYYQVSHCSSAKIKAQTFLVNTMRFFIFNDAKIKNKESHRLIKQLSVSASNNSALVKKKKKSTSVL